MKPPANLGANYAVPLLINSQFPSWFAGFAFAAISIGALVPAAVMSIAAANLFTRNIFKAYISPNASDRAESTVAKWASLVLKFGAVLFIIYIPTSQVINFQLLGGIWILQTLPAVFLGLYTNWFNRWALLIGWLVAEVFGTILFAAAGSKSVYAISIFGINFPGMYTAFSMIIVNLLLAIILTPIFNVVGLGRGRDATSASDYDVEEALPVEVGREALG